MDHKNETFYKFCWNFFSYKKHYYCRCKTDCSKYCFISDVHSKYYNFFSIGVISMNKFLIAQKHSLCLFSRKKIEFVWLPPKKLKKKTSWFCLKILVSERSKLNQIGLYKPQFSQNISIFKKYSTLLTFWGY